MSETFYKGSINCQWLRETVLEHVKSEVPIPRFRSFTLVGNEDCPQRISLYEQGLPTHTQGPIAVYILDADSHPFVWRDETIKD